MATVDTVSIDLLLELRKHAHIPEVLVRQIKQHFAEKAGVQSVLLRQLQERQSDLEACEKIADQITSEAWGMF